jgi:hypothetical protein
MSFPYLTDLANAVLGTHRSSPILTFGLLVATAIVVGVLATLQSRRLWIKALVATGVLGALSACVPA